MNIDVALLNTYGASSKLVAKGTNIFCEDEPAKYFYQIQSGKVKMTCFNEVGKKITFLIFEAGNSFGEPPLLLNEKYPAYAIAETNCTIISLGKEAFMRLLDDHPQYKHNLLLLFAQRLYNKTYISKLIISESPEQRILALLHKYKKENGSPDTPILIRYTRQEIADFTGLRVETIIRTIKKMHDDHKLEIKDRKVYF